MDISELDTKVVIKCFKEKRGERTFVIDLYKYFDDVEDCNEYCKKLKKSLGTSMNIQSASNEEKPKEKSKSKSDDEDGDSKVDVEDEETGKVKEKGKKKRKEKKNSKKAPTITDPIYSFRGNQVERIATYLRDKGTVPAKEIKT
jgi:hypothetical protein